MGKKSDDSQNLVDEKVDDQTISSNASSSRRKRRDKSKKTKDVIETTTNSKLEMDKDLEPETTEKSENKDGSEKKRPRDKRRKKEKVVIDNEMSEQDEGKLESEEESKPEKVSTSQSRRPKTSKFSRAKKSSKSEKLNDSQINLRDNSKEAHRVESSENLRSDNSKGEKRTLRKKRQAKKEVLSEDDEETTRSSLNIAASNEHASNQRDEISSDDEHRHRKFKKNKDKSPRSKENPKASEKSSKMSSQGKRSKTTKEKERGSQEGSKQSLRGVDNPVYDVDDYDEYSDGRTAYSTALYGLDDDILDSPFEEEGDVDSEDEGKAYRLPPAVSPMDLSPSSPYLLQPHFVSTSGNPNTLSEPVNQIYREKVPGRFSKTSQKKISTITKFSNNQVEPQTTKPSMTPLDLGLECQKVFRAIGVFSHGFLAGMAFWQLLMVYILSQEGLLHEMFPGDCQKPDQIEYCDQLKFVELYSPLSQPLHLVFYLLTTICTISIMDRYDIAQFDFRQLQMMLTFRSGGIAVAIYVITLIITLVSTRYDDKLSLHRVNETIYEDLDQDVLSSEISIWKALNLCRSIGVILGWFLISMRPNTDLLYKHLKKLSIFGGEKQGLSYNTNAPLKA